MLGKLTPKQGYHQKKKRRITRVTLICQECGKEYEAFPYEAKTRKFCSRTCSSRNYHKTTIIYELKTKKCLHCGEEFTFKSYKRKKDQRFCSTDCCNKWNWNEKNKNKLKEIEREYNEFVCNV